MDFAKLCRILLTAQDIIDDLVEIKIMNYIKRYEELCFFTNCSNTVKTAG